MVESGNCRGGGKDSEGTLRPRGPSGDDCNESVAGLAVDEGLLGVAAEAVVAVNGTAALMYCLVMGWTEGVGVGDGQHLLLLVMLGDEVVAVGVMLDYLERIFTGSLRDGGCKGFRDVSNGFGGWSCRRFSCAVDDGEV